MHQVGGVILLKDNKHSAYMQIVTWLILLTVIIVSAASFIAYSMFDKFYKEELAENDRRIMEYETSRFYMDVFYRTRNVLSMLAVSPQYGNLLGEFCHDDVTNQNHAICTAYDALKHVSTLYTPMIASIIVYYPEQNMIISNNMGYKSLDEESNNKYSTFAKDMLPFTAQGTTYMYMKENELAALEEGAFIIGTRARWMNVPNAHRACIAIVLTKGYVQEALSRMTAEGSSAYLFDELGGVIAESKYAVELQEDLIENILKLENYKSMQYSDDMVTVSDLAGTKWSIALVTPMGTHQRSSRAIARIVLMVVVLALLIGVAMTFVVSQRLYSPIEQMMVAIASLPTQLPTSAGEYATVHAAINNLSLRLNDAERLLHVNRPLMRNIQVENLLAGMTTPADFNGDEFLAVGLELPYQNFCALLLELNGHKLIQLPLQERRLLMLALRNVIEKNVSSPEVRIYGCINRGARIGIVLNAEMPDDAVIDAVMSETDAFLREKNVEWALSRGDWVEGRENLPKSWDEALTCSQDRFYLKMGHRLIKHRMGVKVPPPMIVELEDNFATMVRQGRNTDAIAFAQRIAALWAEMPTEVCARSITKLSEVVIATNVDEGLDLKPLEHPQEACWNMSDYLPVLCDILKARSETVVFENERASTIVNKTREYIKEHLADELSLENIASSMHFNPKYFSRMFKELSGMQLTDFITGIRMERAAVLLRENSLPIETIATIVGYNSPQYFMRRFKQTYGMTPREYRVSGQINMMDRST